LADAKSREGKKKLFDESIGGKISGEMVEKREAGEAKMRLVRISARWLIT